MTAVASPPPASQADVATVKATADAAMKKADEAQAQALTGADRQQALRVRITPDAAGRYTFVYPREYVTGIVPAVTTTAETPKGAAYRNDASVEEGTATHKEVVIVVQRIPKTLVATALGATLTLIAPVTTPVWINVLIRAPV